MPNDWYPRNVPAWRGGTRHMTIAEKGAYSELIDEYMASGKPLPDNDRVLAAYCGASIDEWMTVAPVVRVKFEASNGKLVHKRCEEELHARNMLQARRKRKAKLAAEKRWLHHNLDAASNAHSMPQAMLGDATLKKDKDITSIFPTAPREVTMKPTDPGYEHALKHGSSALQVLTREQNIERGMPPASLASALPTGALTRPANTEPAATNGKAVYELSRQELEEIYSKKRMPIASPSDGELEEIPFDAPLKTNGSAKEASGR